jgi:hypothetical protein
MMPYTVGRWRRWARMRAGDSIATVDRDDTTGLYLVTAPDGRPHVAVTWRQALHDASSAVHPTLPIGA